MKIHRFIPGIFSAAGLAGVLIAATAHAETLVFDPDGNGLADGIIIVDDFDFQPGNALSAQAVVAIEAGPGNGFVTYAHARIAALSLEGHIYRDLKLNKDYEITAILGFPETVAATLDLSDPPDGVNDFATFALDKSSGPNFFEMYQGPINANNLTGEGFADGTRILAGEVVNTSGNFSVNNPVVQFDQFSSLDDNDYPGISTVTGNGTSNRLIIRVDYANTDYFPTFNSGDTITISFLNLTQQTPFQAADPSQKFYGSPGAGAPTTLPMIGTTNGYSGPDFQAQTDNNMVFTVVPEDLGACRMTGGGVVKGDPFPSLDKLAKGGDGSYTFGGQIGAPTAQQPDPQGNWQHNQHGKNAFSFHVPTITKVTCDDPGYCDPARPAYFKQLDFEGVGEFNNVKGFDFEVGVPRAVHVHFEDIGEPGPGGKQPDSAACTHTPGTPVDEAFDCTNCPDVYMIEIHETEDLGSDVIYAVGGFIDVGNIQIHPEVRQPPPPK